jgi:hypothetical protein
MDNTEEHWSGLQTKWMTRTHLAAEWLQSEPAVADIGCGLMALRPLLRPGTTYVPVDITRRDENTIVVDLNSDPLPMLRTKAAAVLGVFEYISDIPSFFHHLRQFEKLVVSYNHYGPKDIYSSLIKRRKTVSWINRYTRTRFEGFALDAGFEIVQNKKVRLGERAYLLEKKNSFN